MSTTSVITSTSQRTEEGLVASSSPHAHVSQHSSPSPSIGSDSSPISVISLATLRQELRRKENYIEHLQAELQQSQKRAPQQERAQHQDDHEHAAANTSPGSARANMRCPNCQFVFNVGQGIIQTLGSAAAAAKPPESSTPRIENDADVVDVDNAGSDVKVPPASTPADEHDLLQIDESTKKGEEGDDADSAVDTVEPINGRMIQRVNNCRHQSNVDTQLCLHGARDESMPADTRNNRRGGGDDDPSPPQETARRVTTTSSLPASNDLRNLSTSAVPSKRVPRSASAADVCCADDLSRVPVGTTIDVHQHALHGARLISSLTLASALQRLSTNSFDSDEAVVDDDDGNGSDDANASADNVNDRTSAEGISADEDQTKPDGPAATTAKVHFTSRKMLLPQASFSSMDPIAPFSRNGTINPVVRSSGRRSRANATHKDATTNVALLLSTPRTRQRKHQYRPPAPLHAEVSSQTMDASAHSFGREVYLPPFPQIPREDKGPQTIETAPFQQTNQRRPKRNSGNRTTSYGNFRPDSDAGSPNVHRPSVYHPVVEQPTTTVPVVQPPTRFPDMKVHDAAPASTNNNESVAVSTNRRNLRVTSKRFVNFPREASLVKLEESQARTSTSTSADIELSWREPGDGDNNVNNSDELTPLQHPQNSASQGNTPSLKQVQDRPLRDADGRKGWYAGTLCRISQLPEGSGTILYQHNAQPPRDCTKCESYTGQWHHGEFHGHGILVLTSGDQYTGAFLNGRKQGTGTYRFHDGRVFDGQFQDDAMKDGTMEFTDGTKYVGLFANHKRNGFGTYFFDASKRMYYEGQWENDQVDGRGRMQWSDGSHYNGDWKNGQMDGFGTHFNEDGTIEHQGRWVQGLPVVEDVELRTSSADAR